jgi:GNAT superfamily N-acetyltransferase
MKFRIRNARLDEVDTLAELIKASVRGLQANDYSQRELEGAIESVYGVDTQLIQDGTYFVAEAVADEGVVPDADDDDDGDAHMDGDGGVELGVDREAALEDKGESIAAPITVACGGWSKRKTLYGADHFTGREDTLLDPKTDPAKIRAFFVHPEWARRGIGTLILEKCEAAAQSAGFKSFEMGATLTGVPMYKARGYEPIEDLTVPLKNGESLAIVKMRKRSDGL